MAFNLVKELLSSIDTKDTLFKYTKIMSYHEVTRDPETSFLFCPEPKCVYLNLESHISSEAELIKKSLEQNVNTEHRVLNLSYADILSYYKENVSLKLTNKVAVLPVYDLHNVLDWDGDVIDSLSIKVDGNKTLLENIHYNMITNNMVMKNLIPCMMSCMPDFKDQFDYDYIYDKSLEFIETIMKQIHENGIDYDKIKQADMAAFIAINSIIDEQNISIHQLDNEEVENIILLILYNARDLSQLSFDENFIKNSSLIRKMSKRKGAN